MSERVVMLVTERKGRTVTWHIWERRWSGGGHKGQSMSPLL